MIANILFTAMGTIAAAQNHEPSCRPFRVHLEADLPPPPPKEEDCVSYYTKLDFNNNGIRDWALAPGDKSAGVLYPNDDDIDGDGLPNILDPKPLTPQKTPLKIAANGIPQHLAMDGKRGAVQGRIYREYGILAIDHSDRHALVVLESLEKVLAHGFSEKMRKKIKSIKYVYAFTGHDSRADLAAYHREVKAISIGGESAYSRISDPEKTRLHVMASIAHEFGHAFLFDEISPEELSRIGARYGMWDSILGEVDLQSLLDDKRAFHPHPLRKTNDTQSENHRKLRQANVVSDYATTNLHEWFADAFAAATLSRLKKKKLLPKNWNSLLKTDDANSTNTHWIDYANLSPQFRLWFERRGEQDFGR